MGGGEGAYTIKCFEKLEKGLLLAVLYIWMAKWFGSWRASHGYCYTYLPTSGKSSRADVEVLMYKKKVMDSGEKREEEGALRKRPLFI